MTLLQEDRDSLDNWNILILMSINAFLLVLMQNYHQAIIIIIGINQLSQSESHCYLGVLQSSDLSWSQHYNNISANAYKSLAYFVEHFLNTIQFKLKNS